MVRLGLNVSCTIPNSQERNQGHLSYDRSFFDGKCGLCSKEISYYQGIAPVGIFVWKDIANDPAPFKSMALHRLMLCVIFMFVTLMANGTKVQQRLSLFGST